MYSLDNDQMVVSVERDGRLASLRNKVIAHEYAAGGGLWRLIYSCGPELEIQVRAEDCVPEVTVSAGTMRLHYPILRNDRGEIRFAVTLTAELRGDEVHWQAELANHEDDKVIREFHFPILRDCRIEPEQRLIWSHIGGERLPNIHRHIMNHHTQYMSKDQNEVRISSLYPGYSALNAMVIEADGEGLYLGSHDPEFQFTLHLLAATPAGVSPMLVKYPFLTAGQSRLITGYVISPYVGSWHMAAKKYRAWADTWFKPQKPLPLVRDMNGWQRIIMRHQYGEVHYRYDQMERIYHDGAEAGIDTLFMFGWNRDGHDAGYPEYVADESQGGFPALRENVRKFRTAGGKLILYFNGQLIDMNTEFYRRNGKRISVKKADGNEYMEVYPFGGDGTASRQFGNKTFVTACPGCEEWLDTLKKCVDTAIDLGADGVFFDQLGWVSQPCYDPSHGHPVPLMNAVKVKADMLQRLNRYVKERAPQMAIGIEWLSDLTAQHVDFVHNMSGGSRAVNDWEKTGNKPELRTFMDWFYYIFPEVRTTDREIRDDTDIERRVNRALVKGLRSDVEIYRCRRTIAETPHYRAYLAQANRLRSKYRRIILNGTYCDTDGFATDTTEIDASAFRSGSELAIVATQSHLETLTATLKVPGGRLIETDGLNGFKVTPADDGSYRLELSRHGLVILLFQV